MRNMACRLALVAAALAGAGAEPASAADPMPCRGVSFADANDAAPNRDIREGWFTFSAGRLTANLRLDQVDQQLETGETSAKFAMYYSANGAARFVAATTNGRTWSFEYGDDGGGDGIPEATSGSVQPGPGGVIEIEIPAVHAGQGDRLFSVHARSFESTAVVSGSLTDSAPDDRNDGARFPYGEEFVADPCPEPQPQPQPQPPQQQQQPSPEPPGRSPDPSLTPVTPQTTQPAAMPRFAVTLARLRARSLRRGRSFKVAIRPSAPVTALVVTLRRGTRVLATGRRASLTRASAVKVRVRRRITRGAYTLTISGRTPAGETARSVVRVRIA